MLRMIAVCLFALSLPVAAPALAKAQDSITCESHDNKYRECRGFDGRARLERNLSDAPCTEGRTWGARHGVIWVDRGCRGRFVPSWTGNSRDGGDGGNLDHTVRCESTDNRTRECAAGFRKRAVLTRQLSDTRCVEGRSWGQRGADIWVSQGCRGEFSEARGRPNASPTGNNSNYSVTCSSNDNRRHTCGWERRYGRPIIIRQLSKNACIEGRTWAFLNGQIWVDEGCRAQFGGR